MNSLRPTLDQTLEILSYHYRNQFMGYGNGDSVIGILVAHAMHYKLDIFCEDGSPITQWLDDHDEVVRFAYTDVIKDSSQSEKQFKLIVEYDEYHSLAKEQIDATGYKPNELMMMETAWLNSPHEKSAAACLSNSYHAACRMLFKLHDHEVQARHEMIIGSALQQFVSGHKVEDNALNELLTTIDYSTWN